MGRHFLDINEIDDSDIKLILDHSYQFKYKKTEPQPLKNPTLGLLFEKPSLRTRVSFEEGIKQLGGSSISLKQEGDWS